MNYSKIRLQLFLHILILTFISVGLKAQEFNNNNEFSDKFYWGGFDASITSILEYNNELYVTGGFKKLGFQTMIGISKWDGLEWNSLNHEFDFWGNELFEFQGDLYVLEDSYKGKRLNGLARWDQNEWSLVSFYDSDSRIRDYTIHDNKIVVITDRIINSKNVVASWNGVTWNQLGNENANFEKLFSFQNKLIAVEKEYEESSSYSYIQNFKEWNGESWVTFEDTFTDSSTFRVIDFINIDEKLVFTESYHPDPEKPHQAQTKNRIVEWDGSNRKILSLPTEMANKYTIIHELKIVDSKLVGYFEVYNSYPPNGNYSTEYFFAKWTGDSWEEIKENFKEPISTFSSYNGSLIVSTLGGNSKARLPSLYYLSDGNWLPIKISDGIGKGLDDQVHDIVNAGDDIIVGGDFTKTSEKELNYIAKWNGSDWSKLGNGLNGKVFRLGVHQEEIIATIQEVDTLSGFTFKKVMQFDGENWDQLGQDFEGWIYEIFSYKDTLIIAGDISESTDDSLGSVLFWNGNAWENFGQPKISSRSYNMVEFENQLLVSTFNTDSPVQSWNGVIWKPLDINDFNPYYPSSLEPLFVFNDTLYYSYNSNNSLYKYDSGNNTLETLIDNDYKKGSIRKLTSFKNKLIGIGENNRTDYPGYLELAWWDKGKWNDINIDIGSKSRIYAALPSTDGLYIGGRFTAAGGNPAYNFTKLKNEWNPIPLSADDNFDTNLPNEYQLLKNYPNPFNPSTNIDYYLPTASNMRIEVYTILGQLVRVIKDSNQSAGWHNITFEASDLSTGVYFYRLNAGNYIKTQKMTLIK